MEKRENNHAFIDAQNLHKSIQKQGWILDWGKFRIYLKEKYSVTRAYVFIGFVPSYKKLYKKIKGSGFKLIFKKVLKDKKGTIKGNIDSELFLRCLTSIDKFNKAILITGDGDFGCLIQYLRSKDKFKVLLVPNENEYSVFLKKTAKNEISFINKHKHLLLK